MALHAAYDAMTAPEVGLAVNYDEFVRAFDKVTRVREYSLGINGSDYIAWSSMVVDGYGRFSVDADTGFLLFMSLQDARLHVEPVEGESEEELMARVRAHAAISVEDARRTVRAFLRRVYPDMSARSFKEVSAALTMPGSGSSIVDYLFQFYEVPDAAKGELAVYPNPIMVSVNPRTGRVTHYRAENRRARICGPLPVDRVQAMNIAEREAPARYSVGSLDFSLNKRGKPQLIMLAPRNGKPVVYWSVRLEYLTDDAGSGTVKTVRIDPYTGAAELSQ